jgi:plastocyanin
MRLSNGFRAWRWSIGLGAAALLTTLGTLGVVAQSQFVISQKGREFRPGTITIKKGDSVQVINDDADLRHHAYVDSDNFKFDSGDQEPGSKTNIAFPVAGDFDVLCAIHPKMKLVVHVK